MGDWLLKGFQTKDGTRITLREMLKSRRGNPSPPFFLPDQADDGICSIKGVNMMLENLMQALWSLLMVAAVMLHLWLCNRERWQDRYFRELAGKKERGVLTAEEEAFRPVPYRRYRRAVTAVGLGLLVVALAYVLVR